MLGSNWSMSIPERSGYSGMTSNCPGRKKAISRCHEAPLSNPRPSAPGEYRSDIDGAVVVHADGSIRMRDSELLAGSGIMLRDAVTRVPKLTDCTLADAVRMATRNPAAAIGLPAGSLETGSFADLVLFRWNENCCEIEIVAVIVRDQSART